MADTNTNYQTFNGNLENYLGKSFSYGDLTNLNSQMGQSAGNQPTFINGGNIYQVKDNGNNTFGLNQIDTVGNRQAEQAKIDYQQQAGSAVSTLKDQKSSLGQQYSDLLKTVNGEYQPLINKATSEENNFLGARGITSDSGMGQTQMNQSLQGIYGQEAGNAQQLGQGSINDMNTLSQAIAGIQSGNAQFSAGLPLQYGSLALSQSALPASIAQAMAQAHLFNQQASAAPYVPTGVNGITFNAANNTSSLLGSPLNISSAQLQKIMAGLA